MDKLLEVREFDTITGNADFKSDEKYKYLDSFVFDKERCNILNALFERTVKMIVESFDYFLKIC